VLRGDDSECSESSLCRIEWNRSWKKENSQGHNHQQNNDTNSALLFTYQATYSGSSTCTVLILILSVFSSDFALGEDFGEQEFFVLFVKFFCQILEEAASAISMHQHGASSKYYDAVDPNTHARALLKIMYVYPHKPLELSDVVDRPRPLKVLYVT
jgi:hypothetical protein